MTKCHVTMNNDFKLIFVTTFISLYGKVDTFEVNEIYIGLYDKEQIQYIRLYITMAKKSFTISLRSYNAIMECHLCAKIWICKKSVIKIV